MGSFLYVGLSTDAFNLKEKNKKLIQSFQERKNILKAIRYVDFVFPETSWEQKLIDIKKYKIDIFVIGDDWIGKFNFLEQYCKVVYLPRTQGISSSKRKEEIVKKFS